MSEQTKDAVQVGALIGAVPSNELAVQNAISSTLQTVQDEKGNNTALSISSNAVQVNGQDVPGYALPLSINGTASTGGSSTSPSSWGRLIRVSTPPVAGQTTSFFDIGIDKSGNFFINGPSSTPTVHLLAFSSAGIQPTSSAPKGANLEGVVVDTNTGILYYQ